MELVHSLGPQTLVFIECENFENPMSTVNILVDVKIRSMPVQAKQTEIHTIFIV